MAEELVAAAGLAGYDDAVGVVGADAAACDVEVFGRGFGLEGGLLVVGEGADAGAGLVAFDFEPVDLPCGGYGGGGGVAEAYLYLLAVKLAEADGVGAVEDL